MYIRVQSGSGVTRTGAFVRDGYLRFNTAAADRPFPDHVNVEGSCTDRGPPGQTSGSSTWSRASSTARRTPARGGHRRTVRRWRRLPDDRGAVVGSPRPQRPSPGRPGRPGARQDRWTPSCAREGSSTTSSLRWEERELRARVRIALAALGEDVNHAGPPADLTRRVEVPRNPVQVTPPEVPIGTAPVPLLPEDSSARRLFPASIGQPDRNGLLERRAAWSWQDWSFDATALLRPALRARQPARPGHGPGDRRRARHRRPPVGPRGSGRARLPVAGPAGHRRHPAGGTPARMARGRQRPAGRVRGRPDAVRRPSRARAPRDRNIQRGHPGGPGLRARRTPPGPVGVDPAPGPADGCPRDAGRST